MKDGLTQVKELKDKIHEQYFEIERLKELCDRYEEEHNNEFKKWQEATRRINKAIEYLESYNIDFKHCKFGEAPISMRELGDLLDILKGVDKE